MKQPLPLQPISTATSANHITSPIPNTPFLKKTIPNTPISDPINTNDANKFVSNILPTLSNINTKSIYKTIEKIPQAFQFPDTHSTHPQTISYYYWLDTITLLCQWGNSIILTGQFYQMPSSPLHANRVTSSLINAHVLKKGFTPLFVSMQTALTFYTLYSEELWSAIQQTGTSILYMMYPSSIKTLQINYPTIFKIYKHGMAFLSLGSFSLNAYSWYQNNYGDNKENYKIKSNKSKHEFYNALTNITFFTDKTQYHDIEEPLFNFNTERNAYNNYKKPLYQANITTSITKKTAIEDTNLIKDICSVIYDNYHLIIFTIAIVGIQYYIKYHINNLDNVNTVHNNNLDLSQQSFISMGGTPSINNQITFPDTNDHTLDHKRLSMLNNAEMNALVSTVIQKTKEIKLIPEISQIVPLPNSNSNHNTNVPSTQDHLNNNANSIIGDYTDVNMNNQ